MAMVKQSSSRYEQKRIERLESEIRAAQQSGISSDQIKQVIGKVYSIKKHATEEGNVTRLDVDKWDGKVFDNDKDEAGVHKHLVLSADTYRQFEGKRSQRFSRPVAKIFRDHPELLEQYNLLRDHRFSRFMAIDIVTKDYSEKGNNKDGHEELSPKETHPLDLTTQRWQTFMKEHKALFAKMYDIRIHEGLSHLQAVNSIFKDMDHAYRATNGRSIFDRIDEMPVQTGFAGKVKYLPDFKAKDWNPELRQRYFKHFKQNR
ncbi:MAG: hypothetical protein ABSF74_00935 [Dehalococcoidia bacterium]|jgi:hypothetical protein